MCSSPIYCKQAQTPLLVIILSGISVRTLCLTAHCIDLFGSFFNYIFFSGSAYPCLFFVEVVSLQSLAANSTRTTIGYLFMYRECKGNYYLSVFFFFGVILVLNSATLL